MFNKKKLSCDQKATEYRLTGTCILHENESLNIYTYVAFSAIQSKIFHFKSVSFNNAINVPLCTIDVNDLEVAFSSFSLLLITFYLTQITTDYII